MLDRESTFKDKSVVAMLKQDFIPVAFDQWYLRQQQDVEGRFYQKIAEQGPRGDMQGTTQGFYVAEPDGTLYFYNNNRGPDRIRTLMKAALRDYKPKKVAALNAGKTDAKFDRKPSSGTTVVRVRGKVLGGYGHSNRQWDRIFQSAISRDNLWILEDERKALIQGEFPQALATRLIRFHLTDNTRGEPPMWRNSDIKKSEWKLDGGKLTARIHAESSSGDRGYIAELYGHIETKDNQLTRFDLVAKGNFWGHGRWTPGAPQGKFPLAFAFELADGKDAADAVAPQGTKGWLEGYLKNR